MSDAPFNGGSNRLSHQTITVRRSLALGDVLAATVVADKLAAQGVGVMFQAHAAAFPILKRCANLTPAVSGHSGRADVNLDGAYEKHPGIRTKHMHAFFMDAANAQLAPLGINLGPATNCKPRLRVSPEERELARAKFNFYPRPWVFICPRSETYPMRQVPDATWQAIASRVQGTKFWLGLHPSPAGIVDVKCTNFDTLIVWLSAADLLLTVDTGPMHVAAALNVPIVVAVQSSSPDLHLNDQNDYMAVSSGLECLNCQLTLCPINPVTPPCQAINTNGMVAWANSRLYGQKSESVSCVIPIYQPEASVLNRCLAQILPQVSEVIVTRAQDGIVPRGTLEHPKIRHVTAPGTKIGFGRNVNYGCRWANGKYLLLLNDDCFLEPDAVEMMMREMRPGVGMVSHLLRYPDGRIYHAGVFRKPGDKDWHHIDHLRYIPTFQEPVELENVCGTSILVRREMHYAIGGFDEDFWMYSEDNDYAMRCRLHGWKVMFTPHAKGVHLSHQSSEKLGDVAGIIRQSNALFHKKWGAYLRHNIGNNIGNFDYQRSAA